jgi:septal ring factor EnvC (AmiA/AmiB activator)
MIEPTPKIAPIDKRFPPVDEVREPPGTPFAVRAAGFVLAIIAIVLAVAAYQLNSVAAKEKAQLVKAGSETEQAKADLGKANARSADLQLQLDKAKGERSDLQAQLDKAQVRQSDLQSQLEKARDDLRSQVDKAKAQVSEMQAAFQAKVNSANDESSRLRKELDQAKGEAEDLKPQLAKAQGDLAKLQPLIVKARVLPVAVSFEKNFWARGFTMHVKNLNTDPLKVSITIGGSGKASAAPATVEGGGSLNVENLPAGAKVVVESAGYDTLRVTAQ